MKLVPNDETHFAQEQMENGEAVYNYAKPEHPIEELSGVSVFVKDKAGGVYHTYSSYGRGDEAALGTYFYLDLTPKGRNENGPHQNLMDWVRHHDRYGENLVDVMELFRSGKLIYEART